MTSDRSAHAAQVGDVLAVVVASGARTRWPEALVEDCRTRLGVAGVGLTLADATGPTGVIASTDGMARDGEELPFSLGEGPCRTASATGRVVHCPDVAHDDRWLVYGREAVAAGIAAITSAPLQVGAVPIGVLNVYRSSPGPLTYRQRRDLGVYTEAATATLLLLAHGDGDEDGVRIAELADIRPVVHQAAGMVSVQLDVDLVTALQRLRAHAFAAGLPLRDVATSVVARRLVLADDAPPPHDPHEHDPSPRDGDEHT